MDKVRIPNKNQLSDKNENMTIEESVVQIAGPVNLEIKELQQKKREY